MANLINLDEIKERQDEFVARAREMFDKAVESGKTYVEVTRSNIETEVEDLFGRVRDVTSKGQAAVQEQATKQLETVQRVQHDLVGRTEALIEQYGPEIEKRIPVAASAIEMAEQLVKSADEQVKSLLDTANSAVTAAFPIEGYDELNVAAVKKALQGLVAIDLEAVKAYEAANKNRKSVLKEIEDLLSA